MANKVEGDNREDLTEVSDLEDISIEEVDPLFGTFENNKDLLNLLSPKRTAKKRVNELKPTRANKRKVKPLDLLASSPSTSPTKYKKKHDIFEQLQVRMKNPLDKELGFSINKSLYRKSENLFENENFAKLIKEVKRCKEIDDILSRETEEENKKIDIDKNITKWIENNVNKEFLNVKVDGVRLHARWEHQLKKTLRSIIKSNNDIFDLEIINSKILDYPQYCNFKSFTHKGKVSKNLQNISYIFQDLNINRLIESNDAHYVENFRTDSIKYNGEKLEDVVDNLGFDKTLVKAKLVVKRFDNKKQLPLFGCGLQVFKFIKLIEIEDILRKFQIKYILKILILMSIDYNVCKDLHMFNCMGKNLIARDIIIKKIEEFQDNIEVINSILKESFLNKSVNLWFNFINNFDCNKDERLKIFKSKLILKFLICNNIGDKNIGNIEEFKNFEDGDNSLEELFLISNKYFKELGNQQLQINEEKYSEVVLMKIQLIKGLIIINDDIIRKWRNEKDNTQYSILKKSIYKIKNSYFKEYQNRINSIIPKCKRILDFIYHEVTDIDVLDFFIEG